MTHRQGMTATTSLHNLRHGTANALRTLLLAGWGVVATVVVLAFVAFVVGVMIPVAVIACLIAGVVMVPIAGAVALLRAMFRTQA